MKLHFSPGQTRQTVGPGFYGKRLKFGELRYFALGCFVRIVFVREWDEADAFSHQNIF